jgi:outer membrane lipoprotein-sorting protein
MKMKPGIIALITLTLVLSACSASSSTTAAEFEQTAALIESSSYQFTVRSATPSGGKTIQITSLYTMKSMDGTFEAHLPYFGRMYSGGYGDGGSVVFNGEPEKLQVTRTDSKNKISVAFSIQSDSEKFEINLELGPSGYGTLVISSPKRQPVSYYGLASALDD